MLLTGRREMADVLEEETCSADALWVEHLGEGLGYSGRILIYDRLSAQRKWEVYFHELIHAVNDIMAYDREHPLIT